MPDLLIMEGANLFCDADGNSKHLTLTELALPTMQEMYQDHHAGGSRFQIEVNVGIEKPTATFKLAGWDDILLGTFGVDQAASRIFTARGSLRSKATGQLQSAVAVMHGRLGKIEPEAHQRGELQSHDYGINEILHYELTVNGSEKMYFDWLTAEWRANGVSQTAAENAILGIS